MGMAKMSGCDAQLTHKAFLLLCLLLLNVGTTADILSVCVRLFCPATVERPEGPESGFSAV